jgi:hypothetical protein
MSYRRDAKSQGPSESLAKQADVHFEIRSVSNGSAWGWDPAPTKQ